jgi:hypothetical protein
VVTAELDSSGEEVGKVKGEVREEHGAEAEDEVGENDVRTTVGKAVAPRMKPGIPGGRSRIA